MVLVTFTRALARYSRYIAEIKAMRIPPEIISTVDGLFFRKLQRICPEAKYDFDLLEAWVTPDRTPAFFTPEELASELENFLFAEGITEKEYLEEVVPRTGMRRRLSAQQRQVVWQIRQRMAAEMEESRTYTKNYGRLKVLEYLQSHPEDRGIRDIAVLFLDEVQDLNPVALRALRELTRGAMIMAGDGEQSIYSCRSPFRRSGISLRGATRILKTNFRNTIQVYGLADRFRRRSLAAAASEAPADAGADAATDAPADAARPFPFREGPPPELYTARSVGGAAAPASGEDPGVPRGAGLRRGEPLHPGPPEVRDRASAPRSGEGRAGAGGHPRGAVQLPLHGQAARVHPALQQGPGLPGGAAVPALPSLAQGTTTTRRPSGCCATCSTWASPGPWTT